MDQISVSELKNHASRVIAELQRGKAGVVVTRRGRPVAIVLPYSESAARQARRPPTTEELDALAERIGAAWNSPLTAAEAVAEMRR